MDVQTDDQTFQAVLGRLQGIDNDALDIDQLDLERYLNDDTNVCIPDDAIPAVAYSINGHPPPAPNSHLVDPCYKLNLNNLSHSMPIATTSTQHIDGGMYSCSRPINSFNGQGYENPLIHPTLPDSPPDSEPYSPPDGHNTSMNHQGNGINHQGNNHHGNGLTHQPNGLTHQPNGISHQGNNISHQVNGMSHQVNGLSHQESKYPMNPVAAMHQHMYPSHHRPPGMPPKMPPGYSEPPQLNHLSVTQPPPPTSSTPLPHTTSSMNPQILSPAHMSPNMSASVKKRKYSDSPNNTITSALLQGNRNGLPLIKQEPNSTSFPSYLPDCEDDYGYDPDSNNSSYLDGTYQVIKWQPYQIQKWVVLTDANLKDLPAPNYRVDADKGFNFSVPDDTFVCQKKNHFQVTVHIGLNGDPKYVRTQDGVKKIDSFCLHFFGVKMESQTQMIKIEQSQSDRSKKPFHPVRVDLLPDQNNKLTVGRLHFSETTSNNMRKKGRPNPDQRYFLLVVSLNAHSGENSYVVASSASEKIVVRASNPGQFDSDVDVLWQKAQTPDGVYHVGRVGVNTDHPEEALTVHGNMRLTGHLLQPSDIRAKQDLKEVSSKDQLKKVQQMKIYDFNYSKDFADVVGLPENEREDRGVIAQEVRSVLPDAVKETGDVRLPGGKTIENLLVVNKDRIFMENVGAVKELCKLTDNLENRIDELEKMNTKLSKLKRYDSIKSTVSSKSSCSISTVSSVPKKSNNRQYHAHKSSHHSGKHSSVPSCRSGSSTDNGWCSNRFIQITIITLILIMAFCLIAITILYILERQNDKTNHTTQSSIVANSHNPGHHTPQPHKGGSRKSNSSITSSSFHMSTSSVNGRNLSVTTFTADHDTAVPTATTPLTSISIGPYPACSPPNCEKQCCPPPQDDDPRIHPHVIIHGSEHPRIPPYDYIENHTEKNTSQQQRSETEVQHSGNELPGDNTVTVKSVDNNIPDSGQVVINDSTLNDEPEIINTDNGNINTNEINVVYRYRRSTQDDLIPNIFLKELNLTIGMHHCVMCKKNNYTFSAKLSPYFQFEPITLQFKTRSEANTLAVYRCFNHTLKHCPQDLSDRNEEDELNTQGHTEWKLPVGKYFESHYIFRVTHMENSDVCSIHPTNNTDIFAEFAFNFYRTCKDNL